MDDYLVHHGIKGQKWGVWNSETSARYSRTGTILKSNTAMFRVSKRSENDLRPGSYAAIKSRNDYNKYVGVYAGVLANEGHKVVLKEMAAVGDLKIPSHKSSIEMMNKTLDSLGFRSDVRKQNQLKRYLKNEVSEENNKTDRLFTKGLKEFDAYIVTGKLGSNLYDTLNVSFSDKRDNIMRPIITTYMDNLKSNGYAAVVDMNDSKYGVYNSNFPVILADVSKFKVSNIKSLSDKEIEQAKAQLDEEFLNSLRWE